MLSRESSIQQQQRQAVIDELTAFIERHAESPPQLQLLKGFLDRLKRDCNQSDPLLFMELPLSVHIAAGGSQRSAYRVAAACSLAFMGADVLDDLADGDIRPEWNGLAPGEITLAAATCLSALAPLAIAELGLPSQISAALHKTLAAGLLQMAAGQHDDLHTTGRTGGINPESIEKALKGKSGQEFAMFCSLASQAAGASEQSVGHYYSMGLAIGVAGQLASDCYELLEDPEARDLHHGTWTLPLAIHYSRLSAGEKSAFEKLLEQARNNESARSLVREAIRTSGALRITIFKVETYRQQALRALDAAMPLREGRIASRALIDSITFFELSPNR